MAFELFLQFFRRFNVVGFQSGENITVKFDVGFGNGSLFPYPTINRRVDNLKFLTLPRPPTEASATPKILSKLFSIFYSNQLLNFLKPTNFCRTLPLCHSFDPAAVDDDVGLLVHAVTAVSQQTVIKMVFHPGFNIAEGQDRFHARPLEPIADV